MKSASSTTEDDDPGSRKRKWSPAKEESEDESFTGRSATEAHEESVTPGTLLGSDTEASHKRLRLQDTSAPAEGETISGPVSKETRRASGLPLDIWQRICSFLEPIYLGRLICVDHSLNALLDPKKPVPEHLIKNNKTQNDIWSASRKRLLPNFPRPLSWTSELDIWRLLLETSCQFCGRKPSKPSSPIQSPWTSGPGQEGVRVVWPFAVRSCGKCLTTRIIKDADLRFSDLSILLPGLPYAYFTTELNFVTSITLRASSPPLGLDLTRYYFKTQVDQLKHEMDHATSLGQAAAEEWVKGLNNVGRQKMEDSKRFEHFEATGGFEALLQSKPKKVTVIKHNPPAKPALPALPLPSVPTHAQATSDSAGSQTQSPLSAQHKPSPPGTNRFPGYNTPHMPLQPTSPAPGQQLTGTSQPGTSLAHPQGSRGRPERSVGEVNQRKAERRAEIERRCLQLDPPIKATTLPYMDAFNNAMQIPMALNDNAWEVLKPRLIAQHDAALRKEEDFLAVHKNSQPPTEQRRKNEEELKQAQALLERQHNEAQRPVREKLATYADELIRSDWNGGAGVVKDNAPQFAADLLIYVRSKFFEGLDESDDLLQPRTPFTPSRSLPGKTDQHLTLEDMKWVYETKIKPITQRYSKEIFLCGACDIDRKHYALDAVIQHYAAKHTHQFSNGTAVVYWKADWPSEPPFDKKPIRSPRNRPVDHNGVSPMYQRDFGRPHYADSLFAMPEHTYPSRSGLVMTPDVVYHPPVRYAASAYSVDDEVHQPRARLVPIQGTIPGTQMYGSGAGYETYFVPVSPASPAFSARGLAAGPYRGQTSDAYQRPYPLHHYDTMSPAGMNGYGPQPISLIPATRLDHRSLTQPGQPAGFHQIQVTEVARNAREIWDDTDGIESLPDSVRTHVIIQHVVLRFREKYTNEPTLTLFTDALLSDSHMKPLQTLDGLFCKSCTVQDDSINHSDDIRTEYKLPDLLKHFQSSHMESAIPPRTPYTGLDIPRPDWKFDMVQLPDERTIRELRRSPGMTNYKLNLITTVLSRYFEYPLPRLDGHPEDFRPGVSIPKTNVITPLLPRPASPSIPRDGARDYTPLEVHETALGRAPLTTIQQHPRAESATEIPPDDEYNPHDPHRPAAARLGPVLEYADEFKHAHSGLRMPPDPRYAYDDQVARPPPYRLVPAASPRRRFYDSEYYSHLDDQNPAPRRRYLGNEHDLHTRYVPTTSQYLRKPIHDRELEFDGDRDHEREQDPIQQVKIEEHTSPHASVTGTTHFLNNYRVDGDTELSSLPDRASNNASSDRTGRNHAGPRHLLDRLEAQDRPGTGVTSRKGTPRKAVSRGGASTRSRSPSVPRDDARFPDAQRYLRNPANVSFDHEPPQQAQYSDTRYLERPIYEDTLVPQHYIPVSRYRAHSPGLAQQSMELRYVEARPLPRYQYSDDDMYEQPGREYVQVMPRGEHAPQQIERRIVQNKFPEYVEPDGRYGHAVDERNSRAYHEAPPPQDVKSDIILMMTGDPISDCGNLMKIHGTKLTEEMKVCWWCITDRDLLAMKFGMR